MRMFENLTFKLFPPMSQHRHNRQILQQELYSTNAVVHLKQADSRQVYILSRISVRVSCLQTKR